MWEVKLEYHAELTGHAWRISSAFLFAVHLQNEYYIEFFGSKHETCIYITPSIYLHVYRMYLINLTNRGVSRTSFSATFFHLSFRPRGWWCALSRKMGGAAQCSTESWRVQSSKTQKLKDGRSVFSCPVLVLASGDLRREWRQAQTGLQ